jgi:hypothetical protein
MTAFRLISAYYRQARRWGRELTSREAVLPLMYRVRERLDVVDNRTDAWRDDGRPMHDRRTSDLGPELR